MAELRETTMALSVSRVTSNRGPDYVTLVLRGEGSSERIAADLTLEQYALLATGMSVPGVKVRIREAVSPDDRP